MIKTIGFWGLWLGFITYAIGIAPPNQPDTLALIQALSLGQWQGINPAIVALFNLMGILPLIYSCFLYVDGRNQRIPAWVFVGGSFGVGAFALLPYLALRQPNPTFLGKKDRYLAVWESRWTAGAIALGALVLLGYGITQGDGAGLIQQWQTDRFIHVMGIDFCVLCLLLPTLVSDDMARRHWSDRRIVWAVRLLPLLGILAYLLLRPPLAATEDTSAETVSGLKV